MAGALNVWTRGPGVSLVRLDEVEAEDLPPGLQRALLDGVSRGGGAVPVLPAESERYEVRAGGKVVGLLVVARDCPRRGVASVLAAAVDRAQRGHAYAARALLAAERQLLDEGFGSVLARVPRTNGRGLYFMLRAGFVPVAPVAGDDATWFARSTPASDAGVGARAERAARTGRPRRR
jgi:GNAT superfamily N-acetyltransferase